MEEILNELPIKQIVIVSTIINIAIMILGIITL